MKSEKLMNGICNGNCYTKDISSSQIKTSKTNLYIKGLPSIFNDEDIVNLAPSKSTIRSVKAAIEDDKRCKGYGFIDFQTPEDAKSGLAYIQEKNPNYTIKFAKENEKDKTNLYVTNLPKSWTSKYSEKLKNIFEKYGEIQSAFIMLEKYANKPLGVGFVRFFNEESAYMAITDLENNPFLVSDECIGPLEAKYADKHGIDFRRKFPSSKSNLNGKIHSSNQLRLLSNTNSNQLLTALFDNNFIKTPYLSTMTPSNVTDAYNQYMLNVAQFGLIEPYCFLPTVVAPSSTNYYSAYGNNAPNAGNLYTNIYYSMPQNLPGDNVTSPNVPYLVTNTGQNSTISNGSFIPSYNQMV